MKCLKNKLFLASIIALVGVSMVAVGEWLMLYSPTGGYGFAAGNLNFLYPSVNRIEVGFFLAVLSAPVYVLVYYVIARALRLSIWWRRSVIGLAVFGFSVGNVWLGTNAYLAFLVQAANDGAAVNEVIVFLVGLSDPLLQVVRVVVLVLSFIIMVTIAKGQTVYPRLVALLNPAVLIGLIFSLYLWLPEVGNLFLPAALNIAHVIFMIFTVLFLYERKV